MSPADRLDLYRIMGLEISLAVDGRLSVRGPAAVRALAREAIQAHRDELVAYLQQRTERAA